MTPTAPPGLEFLGGFASSGYTNAPYLVRRADGQTLQFTPLLYQLLELLDGRRDLDELAHALSDVSGRSVTPQDVEYLLREKLAPLGVLHGQDGHASSNPLLGMRCKVVASRPSTTRRLAAPFAPLFIPAIVWTVLAAFVGVCWFVLVEKGLASATRQAFDTPGLLLGVFALTILSAGFHELGHAAACRYGGANPGAMGMGLYVVWPAFYTNVDDSYRLDRRGRLRVDLGGLYFNAVVAVIVTALWFSTGVDALLFGVATQLIQMLRQLTPVFRADGYHILADLTGVPDLFAHLGPTLQGLLPSHWGTPSPLTRKARVIVTAWVLVVVPVLAVVMLTAIVLFPRLVATAWKSGRHQVDLLASAAERVDLTGVGAACLQVIALVIPVLGVAYLTARLARSTARGTWKATDERPFLRGVAVGCAIVFLAALFWAWWPAGQYTPVRADERGTLPGLIRDAAAKPPAVVEPTRQTALALVPRGGADADHPALLLVRDSTGLRTIVTAGPDQPARSSPFTLPEAPGTGDNQALAVNLKDGSTVYDIAVVLVTVTDGARVDNENTAYALASCTACTTVSVAFQVVLVVGQGKVVTPINAAVAGNNACLQCVTSALAVQLVVTLRSLPSDEVRAQLDTAMASLDDLEGLDPAEIYEQISAVQQEVLTVLQTEGLVEATATSTAAATATATPTATVAAVAVATASPTASGTSTPSEPAASPTETPTSSPSATPTPTPEPTPTP